MGYMPRLRVVEIKESTGEELGFKHFVNIDIYVAYHIYILVYDNFIVCYVSRKKGQHSNVTTQSSVIFITFFSSILFLFSLVFVANILSTRTKIFRFRSVYIHMI